MYYLADRLQKRNPSYLTLIWPFLIKQNDTHKLNSRIKMLKKIWNTSVGHCAGDNGADKAGIKKKRIS